MLDRCSVIGENFDIEMTNYGGDQGGDQKNDRCRNPLSFNVFTSDYIVRIPSVALFHWSAKTLILLRFSPF